MKGQTYMLGIIALSLALAAFSYTILPDTVAVHWGANGEANGFAPKWFGIILFPIIIAVIYVVYLIVPKIDPLKKNIESFQEEFAIFMTSIQLFLLYVFVLFLAFNNGYSFNFVQWIAPGMAFLLFSLGTFLPHVKRNYLIGFRTPWTLENDDVWRVTHQYTGKMFRIFAFLPLVGLISPEKMIIWIVAAAIVPTVYGILFSYIYFRRTQYKNSSIKKSGKFAKR